MEVDLSSFETQNVEYRNNRKRVNWDDRTAMVSEVFPSAVRPNWSNILGDITVFGRVMRDVLKADQVEPGRAGPRPPLDYDRGVQSLRRFAGDDYSALPFREAVAALIGDDSRTKVSRKTGIERTRCHRLLAGTVTPEVGELEAFARAYRKRPEFFAEYRIHIIIERLHEKLMAEPESSVMMYKRMTDG